MMKNLETEYKNLTKESVPDLWDRIEAGIDNLEPKVVNIDKEIKRNKKRRISRIVPGMAAAAVLLLSCGVYVIMNNSKNYSESATVARATSADNVDFAATADVASEAAEDTYYEEAEEYGDNKALASKAESVNDAAYTDQENCFYGNIDDTSRNHVVKMMEADDSYVAIYVPTEFKEVIVEAVKNSKKIYIEYEIIDDKMREDIGSKYDDIELYITFAQIK